MVQTDLLYPAGPLLPNGPAGIPDPPGSPANPDFPVPLAFPCPLDPLAPPGCPAPLVLLVSVFYSTLLSLITQCL